MAERFPLCNPQPAPLHFYMANMSNMRRELFPELVSAYEIWSATGETGELQQVADRALPHWQALAAELLEIAGKRQDDCRQALIQAIESRTLDK